MWGDMGILRFEARGRAILRDGSEEKAIFGERKRRWGEDTIRVGFWGGNCKTVLGRHDSELKIVLPKSA